MKKAVVMWRNGLEDRVQSQAEDFMRFGLYIVNKAVAIA